MFGGIVIISLGKVALEVDAEKTQRIYSQIQQGGSEACGCAYCRNYRAQLPSPLPDEVMEFLEQCGIDPSKDAEVYEMGETHSGYHCYGGEYYFISPTAPKVDADELPNHQTDLERRTAATGRWSRAHRSGARVGTMRKVPRSGPQARQ